MIHYYCNYIFKCLSYIRINFRIPCSYYKKNDLSNPDTINLNNNIDINTNDNIEFVYIKNEIKENWEII
jgi:hypothetical protein